MSDESSAADRFVPMPIVLESLGVTSSTLYRWMQCGAFPRPRELSKGCVRWRWSEVTDWMSTRPATTGAPLPPPKANAIRARG